MGPRHRPFVTIVLLAALLVLPALDAVCLAACEPRTADAEAALASHEVMADCHDTASSEARVESGVNLTCGSHDQANRAEAVPRTGRDTSSPRPAAERISTAPHLTETLPAAWSRQRAATLSPGASRASLSVVLRI